MANGSAPALARHMHRHVPLLRALPLYLLLGAERGLLLVCGVQDGPVDEGDENRRLISFREHVHHRGGALSWIELEKPDGADGIASRDVLRRVRRPVARWGSGGLKIEINQCRSQCFIV